MAHLHIHMRVLRLWLQILGGLVAVTALTATCAESSLVSPQVQAVSQGLTPHVLVTDLIQHPAEPDRRVAAVYAPQGLYHSVDGGRTWHPLPGPGYAVHQVRFGPRPPHPLIAATADGLYTQVDKTWLRAPTWPPAAAAFALAASPDGTLLVGGEGPVDGPPALWQSRDGRNWQPVSSPPLPPGSGILAVAATLRSLLVGSDGHGLWRSPDGGQSWFQAQEIGATFVARLWTRPDHSPEVWTRTRRGLFRSTDGGHTWAPVSVPFPGRVDALAHLPDGTVLLGLSSGRLVGSQDQGRTWYPVGTLDRDGLWAVLRRDETTAGHLWAGTQWGLYHSRDGGVNWSPVVGPGAVRATALMTAKGGQVLLGNDDGVFAWDEETGGWMALGVGLPRRTVRGLAQGPTGVLFAATDDGVYRSTDRGTRWESAGWQGRSVAGLAPDPTDPNRLLVHLAFERVYSSEDVLAPEPTWTARWEGMAIHDEVLALVFHPARPDWVFAGAAHGLYRSTDGGRSWSLVGPSLQGQSIYALATEPSRPDTLWAGTTRGLYRSTDGGESWHPEAALAGITVSALAPIPDKGGQALWVGTRYEGLYRLVDQRVQAVDVPGLRTVHGLAIGPDGWLYVAGEEGVWRLR